MFIQVPFWVEGATGYVGGGFSPRVGRLLAFRRDPPPSTSGPKAPEMGGGGGRLAAEEGFSRGLASC